MSRKPPPGTGAAERLDVALVHRSLARSRAQAHELVVAGSVLVDGVTAAKPSQLVATDTRLALTRAPDRWVGRGAYKLLEALREWAPQGLSVQGRRCLDVGASTGGFTQVLLEEGAEQVVALDVGHGQLAAELAADPRVVDLPGTNIRDLRRGDLGEPFALVVADLSFISLRLALEPMLGQLAEGGDLVSLVKPQFEVGRDRLARTGVVTSRAEQERVLLAVVEGAVALGLEIRGVVPSPIRGAEGNREYLLWVSPIPSTSEGTAPAVTTSLDRAAARVHAAVRAGEPTKESQ